METAWLNRRRSQDTWSRQICPTETNVNHGYITNASFRWRHPKRQLTLFLFFFLFIGRQPNPQSLNLIDNVIIDVRPPTSRGTQNVILPFYFFLFYSLYIASGLPLSATFMNMAVGNEITSEFPATWGSLTCAQISDVSFSMSYYAPASIDIEFDTDIHLKFCCDKYSNRCVRF